MKHHSPFLSVKAVLSLLTGIFIFSGSAFAKKIYPVKGGDNGIYIIGPQYNYAPGDTFVLKASSGPYAFLEMISVNGTANAPIVIINEGGQVNIGQFRLRHCKYFKIQGVGSPSHNYGFYMTSPNGSQPGVAISGRSSNVEVNNIDINVMGYGFWIKEEAACEDSLKAPNWVIDNISVHDTRMTNINQEGIYAGSTAPNGERSIVCNGITTFPLTLRLGNIKIYNNFIDHTGRGGIQLASAPFGNNEIYNNTINWCGSELNNWQGNGIVLGGYTSAYVHHNTINNTLSSGIFSLGSGLVRIENNTVDNSGNLGGASVPYSSCIQMDTRLTNPLTPVQFIIKNNILGSHTGGYHVRIYKGFYPYTSNNILCSNTTATGATTVNYVETGIAYTGCAAGNQPPTVNAGTDQSITLPSSSVTLSGTATDADGTIATYAWTKVSGPGSGSISSPASPSTQVTGLVQGTYTFRLTANDNAASSAFDEVTVTVNAQSTTPPSSSSIKIEAESYTTMAGIGTENTSDVGGGLNVGWQDNNDWMNYTVNLSTAGTYTVNFRVASYFAGAQFQLKKGDGSVLTTVTVPNTGSFQTWQTVSAQVTLPAGQQTLRIFTAAANGGWNFNWMEILGAGEGSSTNPPVPPSSSTKIEAESYTSMAGIGTENTSDAGGGLNIGWQDNNDWMDYSVNLTSAGTYTVSFRVASFFSGAQFQLRKADGTVLTTVTVPNTGSFQSWTTVSAQVTLPAGQQSLRIFTSAANGGWNFNWWEIQGGSSTTPPPTTPPTTPTSTRIEAESYSAANGVGTENTSDVGGGLNVGWQDNNDWMDYVVNASAAGTYTVNFRVASYFAGAQFQLRKADGTVLATVTVPNTGSFQTWQTVSADVTLPAGQQTLRIVTTVANGGWNINWWEITSSTAAKGTEAAGTVEQIITKTTTAALQVFPNPISDRFMLKVNNALIGKMKVDIYDMKGAVVKQFSVSKPSAGISQSYLSIGDLQTGQYILKVSMENYSESKQLIKQ